jgi:hypothetical protein
LFQGAGLDAVESREIEVEHHALGAEHEDVAFGLEGKRSVGWLGPMLGDCGIMFKPGASVPLTSIWRRKPFAAAQNALHCRPQIS